MSRYPINIEPFNRQKNIIEGSDCDHEIDATCNNYSNYPSGTSLNADITVPFAGRFAGVDAEADEDYDEALDGENENSVFDIDDEF